MQTPLVDSPRHAQQEKIIKQRSPSLILDNDSMLEEWILDNNDFMLKELLLFSLFYARYVLGGTIQLPANSNGTLNTTNSQDNNLSSHVGLNSRL